MNDGNNILRDIIDVEKDIQQSLERTREEMGAWLASRKKELDEKQVREEQELAASFQRSREELAKHAASAHDDLVKTEERRRERIERLTHDAIAGIAAKHIHKILPG